MTCIGAMAECVAEELVRRGVHAAVLFGHSMGALVAFEAARILQLRDPWAIERLVVSGCQCPDVFSTDRLSEILNDDAFVRAVDAYGGLPTELLESEEWRAYAIPLLRADLAACDLYRYEPGPSLSIPILAFAGTEDGRAPVQDVLGWSAHTRGNFDQRVLPGGHFFIKKHMDTILAEICALEATSASIGPTELGFRTALGAFPTPVAVVTVREQTGTLTDRIQVGNDMNVCSPFIGRRGQAAPPYPL